MRLMSAMTLSATTLELEPARGRKADERIPGSLKAFAKACSAVAAVS
jgi:hypothetical protein